MRQGTRKRNWTIALGAIASGLIAASVLVGIWTARPDGQALALRLVSEHVGHMPAPGLAADESGTPPPALRLRAIVARAWDDSVDTWRRLLGERAAEVAAVNLRFVARLSPMNCYGLYAGEGPAYCSGNRTIFVGTDEAYRLMARLGPQGEAGITFLIGHEMGHHIQNIYGRFHYLGHALANAPARRVDLVRRFELEADCFAGVWIRGSGAWANSAAFRSQLRTVLDRAVDAAEPLLGVHGTSAQRTRWFTRGAESGSLAACDTFAAVNP